MRVWRIAMSVLTSCGLICWTNGQPIGDARAAGVDAAVLTGGLDNLYPAVQIVGGAPSAYQLAAQCITAAPSFIDTDVNSGVPSTGVCGSLAGPGTYTNVVCGTGVATGSATLEEPGGEAVSVGPYVIALVSGVGAVVGLGYGDDHSSAGVSDGVALVLPDPVTDCGSLTAFSLALALNGAHD